MATKKKPTPAKPHKGELPGVKKKRKTPVPKMKNY